MMVEATSSRQARAARRATLPPGPTARDGRQTAETAGSCPGRTSPRRDRSITMGDLTHRAGPGPAPGQGAAEISDDGDAQSRVGLIPAVDGHEVRGQRLDLAAVAQPAAVDPADAGDPAGDRRHEVRGRPVIP